MSKIEVGITWNKTRRQWDMVDSITGDFIQEFFPCKNFKKFFKGLNKSGIHYFEVKSRLIEQPEG